MSRPVNVCALARRVRNSFLDAREKECRLRFRARVALSSIEGEAVDDALLQGHTHVYKFTSSDTKRCKFPDEFTRRQVLMSETCVVATAALVHLFRRYRDAGRMLYVSLPHRPPMRVVAWTPVQGVPIEGTFDNPLLLIDRNLAPLLVEDVFHVWIRCEVEDGAGSRFLVHLDPTVWQFEPRFSDVAWFDGGEARPFVSVGRKRAIEFTRLTHEMNDYDFYMMHLVTTGFAD